MTARDAVDYRGITAHLPHYRHGQWSKGESTEIAIPDYNTSGTENDKKECEESYMRERRGEEQIYHRSNSGAGGSLS